MIRESKREMTESEKKEMHDKNAEIFAGVGEPEVDLDMGDWLKEEDKPIGIKKSDGDGAGSAPVKKFLQKDYMKYVRKDDSAPVAVKSDTVVAEIP